MNLRTYFSLFFQSWAFLYNNEENSMWVWWSPIQWLLHQSKALVCEERGLWLHSEHKDHAISTDPVSPESCCRNRKIKQKLARVSLFRVRSRDLILWTPSCPKASETSKSYLGSCYINVLEGLKNVVMIWSSCLKWFQIQSWVVWTCNTIMTLHTQNSS